MAKITKKQTKNHNQAMDLVISNHKLDIDERMFIVKNYSPNANCNTGEIGAFFTPLPLAEAIAIETITTGGLILDLCAGIGTLAFAADNYHTFNNDEYKFVCLESNPEFVEIGKRLMPNAEWILGDMFDKNIVNELATRGFVDVISNPPYGRTKNIIPWLETSKQEKLRKLEYMAAEIALKIAPTATFLIPQTSAPFMFSGQSCFKEINVDKFDMLEDIGIEFAFGCGIDTTMSLKEEEGWEQTNTVVEIVVIERVQDKHDLPKHKFV